MDSWPLSANFVRRSLQADEVGCSRRCPAQPSQVVGVSRIGAQGRSAGSRSQGRPGCTATECGCAGTGAPSMRLRMMRALLGDGDAHKPARPRWKRNARATRGTRRRCAARSGRHPRACGSRTTSSMPRKQPPETQASDNDAVRSTSISARRWPSIRVMGSITERVMAYSSPSFLGRQYLPVGARRYLRRWTFRDA